MLRAPAQTGSAASPKRVLLLVENLPVPFDRRMWMQATTLQRNGYQVTVICPRGQYACGREVLQGVTIYRYPLPSLSGLAGHLAEYAVAVVMTFALTWVVRLREGFDCIQSANPPDLFFLIAGVFKLFGTPFIFDQHDAMPEICESRWQGWKRSLTRRMCLWAERATFRTADRVIATNDSYRAIARTRGAVPDHRITVVRSAPSLHRFRAVPPRPELKDGARFLVAYLGVIGPNDGLDRLLAAIAHIVHARRRRDVRFVIVGSGDLYAQTVALSESLRLAAWVRFTGRISDEEVIDWLSSADVCVAPDPKDALNDISSFNKIVEYMALGRPIVAFDLREARIAADGAASFVPANDVTAFGDAIVALLEAPERRQRMSVAGRRRFETELAWEHQEARLLGLYRELIGSSS
jgi:glycosyltransferase involved in cell wall biosynthesis